MFEQLRKISAGIRPELDEPLKLIEKKFKDARERIPVKDGKVDAPAWQQMPEAGRKEIGAALNRLFRELRYLGWDDLSLGRRYFMIFFSLLIIFSAVHIALHFLVQPAGVRTEKIIDTGKNLHIIEVEIARLSEKAKDKKWKPAPEDLSRIKESVKRLRDDAQALNLHASTLKLLGAFEAEGELGKLPDAVIFKKLSEKLTEGLKSRSYAFLWNDSPGCWFEIAWWAELGTLVGILFYIAGSLGAGLFKPSEIAMFWTEAAIAPLVVLAIFFLFSLTGIGGISLQESSISVNAGIVFILGFAIRRTIGLLDTIKKRIFPEPDAVK